MMVFPAIIMLLATTKATVVERARGKFGRVISEASGLKKWSKMFSGEGRKEVIQNGFGNGLCYWSMNRVNVQEDKVLDHIF